MDAARHAVSARDGFELHTLQSEIAEVTIVPALGAKILSINNRRSGREWLYQAPRLFANQPGDRFAQSTLCGFDDCFPTVAPCRWNNRDLPDHGELWSQPSEIHRDGAALVTRQRCILSHFEFERRLELSGAVLHLDYAATNLGAQPESFLWSTHPLLAIEAGDRVEIDSPSLRLHRTKNIELGLHGNTIPWPQTAPEWKLDTLHLPADSFVKGFLPSPHNGRAALVNDRTGDRLTFHFDPQQLPLVGLFINRGGWSGHHHLAIEPCNGAPDSLKEAVTDWKQCQEFRPGETLRWSLWIEVGAPVN